MNSINEITYFASPDKSESDKKHYKTLMLANGLRVLLVSDPTPVPHDGLTSSSSGDEEESASTSTASSGDSDSDTESEEGDEKLAACSLLIDVGSFAEPAKYQGLAHFMEHMIFKGSEKYPKANAYDAHIKKCGGNDNGHTDFEETCFYYEVPDEHLESCMDHLSALLKAPLMLKESMTRERDGMESEFQEALKDYETRRDQLIASYATEGYPHGTFSWGNLKTLKEGVNDNELHEVLQDFQKRHYSAHRMCLCVQARLSIDVLEEMVVKYFSDIPSNDLPGMDLSPFNYREAFRNEFFEQVIFVQAVEKICKLEVTWILPSMIKQYKCKADQFIMHLIDYEGEGSLGAYLRKKLLALDLLATTEEGGFESNSIYSTLVIRICLTERGLKQLDDVIAAIFAFVKLLVNCGSLQHAYNEVQSIKTTNFRYETQRPAFNNVGKLAVNMKYYPPKDILTGSKLYFEYNEEQIKQVIQHLNEFRFNIMITSHLKSDNIFFTNKEKWFGIEYTTTNIPYRWRELWEKSKPIPELFLPKPNRFISNDFRLYWEENGKPEITAEPKKILETEICELWFRQDDKFNLPQAYMYFYFISPLVQKDPKNDVLCALYERLVNIRLREELYPATLAGLFYKLYAARKGIVLKINGYNEKLQLMMDIIIRTMVSIPEHISEEQFNILKTDQKKSYFISLIKPRTLNKDIRLSIIEHVRWPLITKYKCLDSLTLTDMLNFMNIFTDELYVQTLMQGNLTEETAHNIMNTVLTSLNCRKIKEAKYIENRTVQLPQGSHFIRCRALNDKDVNWVISNFYQIGPNSVRTENILYLLMMLVEKPLFESLRRKEKLGYYEAALVRCNYGIIGYSITVYSQETKFGAAHADKRIEVFRGKMLQFLEEMSLVDFEHARESLIKLDEVAHTSLAKEVSDNWKEITSDEYVFDRKRRAIEVLRGLKKQDIIDFCLNNEKTNFRKLSVQVIGHKEELGVKHAETELNDPNLEVESNQSSDSSEYESVTDDDASLEVESNQSSDSSEFEADTDDDPNLKVESNKSSDSSEHESDTDDEELFNAIASKLDVKFIPKDGDATTITDIKDFKEKLHVYCFTKTTLENPTDRTPN